MKNKFLAGVDVGGTTIKIGLFEYGQETPLLLEKWEIPTRKEDGGAMVIPDIAKSLREKLASRGADETSLTGVGVCVPGSVRPDGTVVRLVNVGWENVPLVAELSDALGGALVFADNDLNAAARAELVFGAARGVNDAVLVAIGTGLGAGIIVDGEVRSGAFGLAGEVGHMRIDPSETEVCGCGRRGCLEQYCSATGMVRMARRYLASHVEESSLRTLDTLSAKALFDAVKAGDAAAIAIAEEICEILALGISYITAVTDPARILIGGGVSKAGQILVDMVERHYKNIAFHPDHFPSFYLAKLGNDAGIFGAAALCHNRAV